MLISMTKRLQVLLEDTELAEIQRLAKRHHQTTAAWVRDALRAARESSRPDVGRRLRAVREAALCEYPTGDIDDVLADVERGYLERGTP